MIKFIMGLMGKVPDGDIKNNDCKGLSYSRWSYCMPCPKCLYLSSQEERMTGICLKCGSRANFLSFPSAAIRKIRLGGKWKEQIRICDTDYIDKVRQ